MTRVVEAITNGARALFVLALLVVASCRVEHNLDKPPPGYRPPDAPHLEVKHKYDKTTGKLLREWSVLVSNDRRSVKEGVEKTFYPGGSRQWDRDYKNGQPAGAWRSWYENGNPRSECFFNDGGADTTMTFWHPNGQKSLQGPAQSGVRRGAWSLWYKNGQLAEQGLFVAGLREGVWKAWSENGLIVTERRYLKNVRVSDELTDDRTALPVIEAPNDPLIDAAKARANETEDEPEERPPK